MRVHALVEALTCHQKAASEVGVDHRLPAFGAGVCQGRDVLPARVVDQAVDAAMLLHHLRDHGFHIVFAPDVAAVPTGLPTVTGDLLRSGGQLVGVAAHQHHMRAQAGQFVRGAAANARAAAGDHDDLPAQQVGGKDRTVGFGCCHVGSLKNKASAASVKLSSEARGGLFRGVWGAALDALLADV